MSVTHLQRQVLLITKLPYIFHSFNIIFYYARHISLFLILKGVLRTGFVIHPMT